MSFFTYYFENVFNFEPDLCKKSTLDGNKY